MRERHLLLALLVLTAAALAVSGIAPHDRTTWWLEVFPVVLGVPILIATRRRFPLTPLLYVLFFVHGLILMLGGHYTYARVPLGFWVQDLLDLSRNHYDRLGHFAQGFVPAILAREILLRRTPLRPGGWLFFLVCSVCLAFSACYEFFEWWAAVIGGSAADAFLGTQGEEHVPLGVPDLFLALLGAMTAQLVLGRIHDRQLARLG
jgi:putative membrane protein